jgi:hypothetical protein
MANTLNLLPTRVPIGQVTDPSGRKLDVLITPEFVRVLTAMFQRMGGAAGLSNTDLEALLVTAMIQTPQQQGRDDAALCAPVDAWPMVAELQAQNEALRMQMQALVGITEQVAELRKTIDAMQMESGGAAALVVDWERPGKIGEATANSGKFTTLTATGPAKVGTTGTAGAVQLARASDGLGVGTATMNGNTLEVDNQAGDIVTKRGGTERIRATGTGATVSGDATATGALVSGAVGASGQLKLARASDGATGTVATFSGNDLLLDSPPGDVVILRGSVERIRATASGAAVSGTMGVSAGFGCNGKSPQAAAASGGTLAGVIAALVANGILSS